jgi:hypothetical protein
MAAIRCKIELAGHVDILDDGILPQARKAQSADEPLVVALSSFAVDEQSEPLLECQRRNVGVALLFIKRLGHTGESKRDEKFLVGCVSIPSRFLSGCSWCGGYCGVGYPSDRATLLVVPKSS